MRELGFSVMWPKLQQENFTTFRFPRKDRDWQLGEPVRIVFHPRGRDRKVLGTAQIIHREPRILSDVSDEEAREDGFADKADMRMWLTKKYSKDTLLKTMNRLSIRWVERKEA